MPVMPALPTIDLCYMIDHNERHRVYPPGSGSLFTVSPGHGVIRNIQHLVYSQAWREGTTPAQVYGVLLNIMGLSPIAVRIIRPAGHIDSFYILFANDRDAQQCVALSRFYIQTINPHGHIYTRLQVCPNRDAIGFDIAAPYSPPFAL